MIITIFDSESDGFLDVATKLWCIATVDYDNEEDNKLYDPTQVIQGLSHLHKADVLVGHNIIKHDLPLFKKLYGWEPKSNQIVLDTLVFSRMLNPKRPVPQGYFGKATHSIEAWGVRLGYPKPDHEDWSQYSEDMGIRCLSDARINRLVLKELERESEQAELFYKQIKSKRCA